LVAGVRVLACGAGHGILFDCVSPGGVKKAKVFEDKGLFPKSSKHNGYLQSAENEWERRHSPVAGGLGFSFIPILRIAGCAG
jgi:hypothetical protein